MTGFFRHCLYYGVWLCGLALTTGHLSGYAQTLAGGAELPTSKSELEKLFQGKAATLPAKDMLFEGPVDPDEYVVGPGDHLDIVFWKPTFTEYACMVNGEGDVVIPYVGLISVADRTLRDARTEIESAVARVMRIGQVTVSLVEPRQFRVHVTGLVENPGSYVVPATARVADAIAMAGGLKRRIRYTGTDTASVVIASQRRIELSDRNGRPNGHADLLLFGRGGLLNANPHLRDGQTIHVPYPAEAGRQVGAFGGVNDGGLFERASGDRVSDVLMLAGGLVPLADSAKVLVQAADGRSVTVDLRTADGRDHGLGPGDRVYVAMRPDTSRAGSVELKGEIVRPGGYPIVSGLTTLRKVLQESGGLLPTAAANSARLIRKRGFDPAEPERSRVLATAPFQTGATAYTFDKTLAAEFARWDYGTVVLDLSGAMGSSGEAGDLKLQDGDVLDVPRQPLGVRVLGAVNQAGEVAWVPGRTLSHYLKEAGGVNAGGWKGRTVIIKARNGSQLRWDSDLPIDPGDVLFVPMKRDITTWETVKDFVAVAAQVATLVLVIQNVRK